MASDDVIKTIVAQVMDKLQANGGPTPAGDPPRSGAPRPGAPRRGLGQGGGYAAARPVGGNLGARFSQDDPRGDPAAGGLGAPVNPAAGGLGAPVNPAAGGPGALVVLTAGDARLDEVYRQLGALGDRYPRLRIFLSPSARKVLDLPAIRRGCPGAELLPPEVTHELRELVSQADEVYLPTLTLSTACKIAYLDGDTAASLLPIFALSIGKPVLASAHALFGVRADYPAAPAGFRQRVEEIMAQLQAVGVHLVDLEALAGAAPSSPDLAAPAAAAPHPGATAGVAAAPGARSAPAVRPTPAPAAPAGAIATASASSSAACTGDPSDCAACGQCAEKNEAAVQRLVNGGADRIGASSGTKVSSRDVASMIDHTALKPDTTEAQIRKLCAEAREHSFASVCVNPGWVALAARELAGSPVKVCTVIGFPLGATTPTAKALETRDAIANGATEVDMVINVGALKSGDDDLVRRDIAAVVESARGQALVKVILETALLSREEKVKGCLLAKMAGADFVKTSTGFSTGGATVEDIALMRETVGPEMGVKASGGIKSGDDAQAMIAAGATRIGASASVAIAQGKTSSSDY